MTKPLWQQMIDASDEALGARPTGIYSAEDALVAAAQLRTVIMHVFRSDAWKSPETARAQLGEDLTTELLAASVTDDDSTTDPSPSAS
jgi:hypothetical protein